MDKLAPGDIVCHACQFCFSDANQALTCAVRKDKPQRMRNYSHFVLNGEWIPCSIGDKRTMLQCLMRNPQVAVIAVSGQKHLIMRARPGWWQIEDQAALPFTRKLADLSRPVQRLFACFTKAEIASGCYSHAGIRAFGIDQWMECERIIKPMRGSLEFRLALLLAIKEKHCDT